MLAKDTVKVVWSKRTKKYYMDLDYKYTALGDEFLVKVEDLPPKSSVSVDVICDYCGRKFQKRYEFYRQCHDEELGDCCKYCNLKKHHDVMQRKYGTKYAMQVPVFVEKRKQTCLQTYGVTSSCQIHRADCVK